MKLRAAPDRNLVVEKQMTGWQARMLLSRSREQQGCVWLQHLYLVEVPIPGCLAAQPAAGKSGQWCQ